MGQHHTGIHSPFGEQQSHFFGHYIVSLEALQSKTVRLQSVFTVTMTFPCKEHARHKNVEAQPEQRPKAKAELTRPTSKHEPRKKHRFDLQYQQTLQIPLCVQSGQEGSARNSVQKYVNSTITKFPDFQTFAINTTVFAAFHRIRVFEKSHQRFIAPFSGQTFRPD